MAITIIKQGKPENYKFKVTCPICGCEFEYELCDLKREYNSMIVYSTISPQYGYNRYVECPCCHEKVIHDSGSDSRGYNGDFIYTAANAPKELTEEEKKNKQYYVDYGNPAVVWNDELDCDKCPNKPDFKNGEIIFGDTPCNWCPKMQPKCTSE